MTPFNTNVTLGDGRNVWLRPTSSWQRIKAEDGSEVCNHGDSVDCPRRGHTTIVLYEIVDDPTRCTSCGGHTGICSECCGFTDAPCEACGSTGECTDCRPHHNAPAVSLELPEPPR